MGDSLIDASGAIDAPGAKSVPAGGPLELRHMNFLDFPRIITMESMGLQTFKVEAVMMHVMEISATTNDDGTPFYLISGVWKKRRG